MPVIRSKAVSISTQTVTVVPIDDDDILHEIESIEKSLDESIRNKDPWIDYSSMCDDEDDGNDEEDDDVDDDEAEV